MKLLGKCITGKINVLNLNRVLENDWIFKFAIETNKKLGLNEFNIVDEDTIIEGKKLSEILESDKTFNILKNNRKTWPVICDWVRDKLVYEYDFDNFFDLDLIIYTVIKDLNFLDLPYSGTVVTSNDHYLYHSIILKTPILEFIYNYIKCNPLNYTGDETIKVPDELFKHDELLMKYSQNNKKLASIKRIQLSRTKQIYLYGYDKAKIIYLKDLDKEFNIEYNKPGGFFQIIFIPDDYFINGKVNDLEFYLLNKIKNNNNNCYKFGFLPESFLSNYNYLDTYSYDLKRRFQ